MPNMREIRERIASIQQILKITNAMYLMSSSKLKKARKALDSTEPYFYKLQETIESVLEHTPASSISTAARISPRRSAKRAIS